MEEVEKIRQGVSIPFKRESPCGLAPTELGLGEMYTFQFPSNGKALSDSSTGNNYQVDTLI